MGIDGQRSEGLRMMKLTARDAKAEKQSELKVTIRNLIHKSEFGQMGKRFDGDMWNRLSWKDF